MKGKSGKITPGTLVLIALVLVAVYYFDVMGVQSLFTPKPVVPTQTTINTVNPYITVTALDKQSPGSAVSVTAQASVDGGGYKTITLGSDTAVPGQTLDLLLTNNTQFHNQPVLGIVVESTSFPVQVLLNKNATVTENMYSTIGVVMTNSQGEWVVNQTRLGNGATYNWKDEMQAASLTSTQDMICVVEIVNGANASTSPQGAILTGGSGVTFIGTSKPSWYTTNSSGSNVYLFDVKGLSSSATQTFNLQINSKSTGQFGISGADFGVAKTCYTKEYFLDPNTGKIVYDAADSDGTVKSMARYVYKVAFGP